MVAVIHKFPNYKHMADDPSLRPRQSLLNFIRLENDMLTDKAPVDRTADIISAHRYRLKIRNKCKCALDADWAVPTTVSASIRMTHHDMGETLETKLAHVSRRGSNRKTDTLYQKQMCMWPSIFKCLQYYFRYTKLKNI